MQCYVENRWYKLNMPKVRSYMTVIRNPIIKRLRVRVLI